MSQKTSLLTLTMIATAAITAEQFVGVTGAPAAAGANAYGVAVTDGAIGAPVSVDAQGTTIVTAGGAIAAGALLQVGTAGKAITKDSGIAVARMAPGASAAADGDRIEVILLPN